MTTIPFSERPTCTVHEGCEASGLGRTTIYALIRDGRIKTVKVGARTLLVVPSLLETLTPREAA